MVSLRSTGFPWPLLPPSPLTPSPLTPLHPSVVSYAGRARRRACERRAAARAGTGELSVVLRF